MIERARRDERGFTLIEVMVCVAVLVVVIGGTLGMFAAIAQRAQPDRTRDLALMVAQNTLVRARSAASYAPASLPNTNVATLGTFIDSRAWVLPIGTHTFTQNVPLISATSLCGSISPANVALTVTTDYEETGSPLARRFSVSVAYPVNPCTADVKQTVTIGEEIPTVSFVPGTRVTQAVAPPWGQ